MRYHNSCASACNFGQLDLCTRQRVFAHGNTEYDTLFPSLLYTLVHTMSLTCSSSMESILCKLSENEALEIWKKFIEQPGFYVKHGGLRPLSIEVYGE
jgi:hypothetical protein